ncbi:cytochrome c3 family protein [uncultured Thermanaerothrix sp.]|uniref:cytochrome c3 family protein n=1 Tax=uncultured Thermanaerothrix sp. TaxID=1195149 RepID=UPI00260ECFDD|nr:cytochrome c3 family protein [uncultured Thermanaerothrix sp.]
MRRLQLPWIIAVVIFTLVAGFLILTEGVQGQMLAAPSKGEVAQKPDNSACLSCHQREGITWSLPNGEVLPLTIDPKAYDHSVHARLSCQVCHTNITGFPHPENTAQDRRDYTLQYQNTCNQCHPNQVKELADSVHARLFQEGNREAPICADCHNPHTQVAIEKTPDGLPAPSEHARIAQTCATCHAAIYEEYLSSVHGSGIIENRNPDVPACTDCHGIHRITNPKTASFRLSSPQLCAKCHTDEAIMSKYGLSTQVLNTYVADFHGTTVVLFQKTDPDQETNKPVCYDCHGVHDIRRVDDPEKGVAVKENLLKTCQRCHPDASTNFPDSWLGHYIPSPDRHPLVYYVNLFYKIFIPTVLGGMAVFVISDVYYRLWGRKRRSSGKEAVISSPPLEGQSAVDEARSTEPTSEEAQSTYRESLPEKPLNPPEESAAGQAEVGEDESVSSGRTSDEE